MEQRRLGIAVWIKNTKAARQLRRYGNVHYVSRRLRYVSMYVDSEQIDEIMAKIRKLDFVTRIERSHRHEIPIEYKNSKPDKAKEFDYKLEEQRLELEQSENKQAIIH
ncbi:hypothetical protein BEP19_00820 [Ammoniphilus oxalaticus]|uniref:UPF0298 protein BEP19_00820 n=1 Tax=Ammoniphilus oxalaticus TaxID=66863 RepID=A0A419SMJ1_9BACL|nr:DUF2129 domain-containing protein [Ammoniphilus oxalaticus]RKD25520.1 hypothetical protein BEP19_00820 [Ammoniphilus oxalaticus]